MILLDCLPRFSSCDRGIIGDRGEHKHPVRPLSLEYTDDVLTDAFVGAFLACMLPGTAVRWLCWCLFGLHVALEC